MVSFKVRDPKTGEYKLMRTGLDGVNVPLGYINNKPLSLSINDVELLKATASDDNESKE